MGWTSELSNSRIYESYSKPEGAWEIMELSRQNQILAFITVSIISISALSALYLPSALDEDGDGIYDWSDNCPLVPNEIQADNDVHMGIDGGNSCDNDDDNDGWEDYDENSCGTDPMAPLWCL